MKRGYKAIALALALTTVVSGCSLPDKVSVKELIMGKDKLDYNPVECVSMNDYKGVEVDCTVKDEEVQEAIQELLDKNKLQVKKEPVRMAIRLILTIPVKRAAKNSTAEQRKTRRLPSAVRT